MTANELRRKYIDFFISHGHSEISSASLIPNNDPSVLFTTAGMHPLVPYLLGQKHPQGSRLVDAQKCLRTGDIDEVGDASHLTFFEMMGNWSLNDYFKTESIAMSHEFLTKSLGIPQERIAVTVFGGDDMIERDMETYNTWKGLGYKESQIFFYGKKDNWWGPAGETGPCGPDTEIFYDMGKAKCGEDCGPSCHCGKYVEIWNNVFMSYNKLADGSFVKMDIHNVDTGLGLERVLTILNGKSNVYETEQFTPIIKIIEAVTGAKYSDNEKAFRIIADHMRASTFILGDDKAVSPSNVDQGYVLRRLIRRCLRYLKQLGAPENAMCDIAEVIVGKYSEIYPELSRNEQFILKCLRDEEAMFDRTLDQGIKVAEKYLESAKAEGTLSGELAFKLYDTFGFPIEFTTELADEKSIKVDIDGFKKRYIEHQEESRAGAAQKFKGGLSDATNEKIVRLHTATHLLDGALRKVLGDTVFQRGSNITTERLRFDFSFERKMTAEEITAVENIVNEAIAKNVTVVCEEMTVDEAKHGGAIGIFEHKYGEKVKVYAIDGYSKEICGGPHASTTGELKHFKILKEESSSAGVRRIKANIDG